MFRMAGRFDGPFSIRDTDRGFLDRNCPHLRRPDGPDSSRSGFNRAS